MSCRCGDPACDLTRVETIVIAQADPTTYQCKACGKHWPAKVYADDCADQDEMEADDKEHGRLYRSNN